MYIPFSKVEFLLDIPIYMSPNAHKASFCILSNRPPISVSHLSTMLKASIAFPSVAKVERCELSNSEVSPKRKEVVK